MQPDYKVGKHHRILADMLMEIEKGKDLRPRTAKNCQRGLAKIVSV
jgi:hypothetical protein